MNIIYYPLHFYNYIRRYIINKDSSSSYRNKSNRQTSFVSAVMRRSFIFTFKFINRFFVFILCFRMDQKALHCYLNLFAAKSNSINVPISVDISHILGNLITVIFNYQILRKPLKILSL